MLYDSYLIDHYMVTFMCISVDLRPITSRFTICVLTVLI